MPDREQVSIVRCAPEADRQSVVDRTEEAVRRLPGYGRGLQAARKIAVKVNAGVARFVLTEGRQTELTDPAVVEGFLRAIRSVTDAEVVIGDAPTHQDAAEIYRRLDYPALCGRYPNVRLLDFDQGPLVDVAVPRPDPMFRRYTMHRDLAEADAVVSVAKMKAHAGMGCTLCMKNLFGWMPTPVYGEPRNYLHDRLIRLPHVIVDLAATWRPCLNVVDGIVAANESEWHGTPLRPGIVVAGTNPVATDAVGMRTMGFDPAVDYPHPPFHYRRNVVRLAAEAGLGPMASEQIEVLGPSPEEAAVPFEVRRCGGPYQRHAELQAGARCVERYREQQDELARRFRGRFLALQDGRVLWDGPDMRTMQRLERESGRDWRTAPQFVVRCVPSQEEIEDLPRYAREAPASVPQATA